VEIYLPAKFRWDISIHGWDKTTSGFGKRAAAILKFYFRFRFWRMYSPRHVILYLPAKFRSNQTIGGWVMTAYRFFKMAAIESEMYFRVQVWWADLFKKVEIYLPAKFRCDISIHGWDKTTSGFGKRTAAILKSISGYEFDVWIVIGMSFYICLPNFVVIGRSLAELWRYICFFQDGCRQPYWIWSR